MKPIVGLPVLKAYWSVTHAESANNNANNFQLRFQCFDNVGQVAGRASNVFKTGIFGVRS